MEMQKDRNKKRWKCRKIEIKKDENVERQK